jgi:hypothetical protein
MVVGFERNQNSTITECQASVERHQRTRVDAPRTVTSAGRVERELALPRLLRGGTNSHAHNTVMECEAQEVNVTGGLPAADIYRCNSVAVDEDPSSPYLVDVLASMRPRFLSTSVGSNAETDISARTVGLITEPSRHTISAAVRGVAEVRAPAQNAHVSRCESLGCVGR